MTKQFRPMLAETCSDMEALRYPVLASPKLDGIRCVIVDGVPLTRKLKPIPNRYVREMLTGLPSLDGEIMLRNLDGDVMPFDAVQSAVMSHEGTPLCEFWVFDSPAALPGHAGFMQRLGASQSLVYDLRHCKKKTFLQTVKHELIGNVERLRAYEEQTVADGFEGVMVRDLHGPYKFGRSTLKEGSLLKIKRWHDMEAYVVGYVERMRNDNAAEVSELGLTKRSKKKAGMVPAGDLGALVLCDDKGHEFEVGTGFTAPQRVELWEKRLDLLGETVTIKYQELTKDGVPRFPVFKGFRHPHDIGEPT